MSQSLDPSILRQSIGSKMSNESNNYIISEKCLGALGMHVQGDPFIFINKFDLECFNKTKVNFANATLNI